VKKGEEKGMERKKAEGSDDEIKIPARGSNLSLPLSPAL
jgi:hypothetical protein